MSVFLDEVVTCPHCHDTRVRSVAQSVNAARSPQYREGILEGDFQQAWCDRCRNTFRIDHPFTYLDLPRRQFFLCFNEAAEDAWQRLEHRALESWRTCGGERPDGPTFDLLHDAIVRAVFGLAALREKLVCFDAGLDDGTLEVFKFSLGLAPDGTPLSATNHLRLLEVKDDLLTFLLGGPMSEQEPRIIVAGLEAYREVEADRARWDEVRTLVTAGPYVDLGRITVRGDAWPE